MAKPNTKAFDHAADLDEAVASNQGNVTPNGMTSGQTLHELTADWWRWILNAPADTNPNLDESGIWAGVENDGEVFFLAGAFAPGEYTRDITVEAGVPLLVPILNNLTFQNIGPAVPGTDPEDDPTVPAQKGLANQWQVEWQKSVTDLFLEIDNVAVKNLQSDLVRTPWFGGEIDPEGFLGGYGFTGDLASANSIGYWSVIDGLAPGEHTLRFGGTAGTFSTEVNVNLTVV
jgi:hypothetical protein